MSSQSSKKRKTFIDLLEDDIFSSTPTKTKNTDEINESTNKTIARTESEEIKNSNKISEKHDTESDYKTEKEDLKIVKKNLKKNTIIEAIDIVEEEPLVKGFHFYSNDRVMNKVKKLAKEKNIKLSKLITMILDKSIRD
ncbi:hypothetical protein [Mycoplasma amphoriforme]|uniref:Uncharacterized protein n=1 Tax=Mycoplasma amphoriforme A39 TaxID=572419 RepID=A0A292IHE8_9MOLU|nr:unnamed protein product [Mycoplasma amphoriforme A39]